MNTFNHNMGIPMTPEQYAEEWEVNSSHFNDNGSYTWMSSQIDQVDRILEVGCGAGYSTLSLANKDSRKIFIIESNIHLAESAASLFKGVKNRTGTQ